MKSFLDLKYGEHDANTVDIHIPEGTNFTTIVNFHGGGLDHGSKRGATLDKLSEEFPKKNYAFATVEYRLYPEAKYPDYLEDCARATAFVKNFVSERGGNGEIVIMGQSAGAWISLMLCLNDKFLKTQGIDPLEVKAWFIDSAQVTSHFKVIEEEHGENRLAQRIDEFAPLYYINENTKFTRMLLILYDDDMACRYEQNMLFYKAVLAFNPEADIQYRLFSGKHCSLGKQPIGEDGEMPYVKTFFDWIQ